MRSARADGTYATAGELPAAVHLAVGARALAVGAASGSKYTLLEVFNYQDVFSWTSRPGRDFTIVLENGARVVSFKTDAADQLNELVSKCSSSRSVPGSWVGAQRLSYPSLFLAASRMA